VNITLFAKFVRDLRKSCLTVVYYNYVKPKAVAELLEAAKIMGIKVQVGIEFPVKFGKKFAYLIWSPAGIVDPKSFLTLLENSGVKELMSEGEAVSEYQQRFVEKVFQKFNEKHRPDINGRYGIDIPELNYGEFIAFVGMGQASTMHLADFIHSKMIDEITSKVDELNEKFKNATNGEKEEIGKVINELNRFDHRMLVDKYLRPSANRDIPDPNVPHGNPEEPALLNLSPFEFTNLLKKLPCTSQVVLNLNKLTSEDVIELLFECKGAISHIEIFNLKDFISQKAPDYKRIEHLRRIINEGNIVKVKQAIRECLGNIDSSDLCDEDKDIRKEKFKQYLHNIENLRDWYKDSKLKARIGSDSAGRMRHTYGMGLAVKETLPYRSQKQIAASSVSQHLIIPIDVSLSRITTASPQCGRTKQQSIAGKIQGYLRFFNRKDNTNVSWHFDSDSADDCGWANIVTLGGLREGNGNNTAHEDNGTSKRRRDFSSKYLNTAIRTQLKVLIGFIPAFLTFFFTKEWFVLKYFGAFIWFAITGFRNITQSVLAGRGFRQYTLLKWSDFVQWERVADSLLYTGFSVPLLDFLVKTLLLDKLLGITTSTNPIALYTIMAIVNGVYISSHNAFRGLPKEAVVGNFFRSILSIPLAILFNAVLGGILGYTGSISGVNDILQKWAAIISKFASDCMAAVIEGTADRKNNIKARIIEYQNKIGHIFDIFSKIEIMHPEKDVLEMLRTPKEFLKEVKDESVDYGKISIINALDMLYFWMYQPRSRVALLSLVNDMTLSEKRIIVRSMNVLVREKEVSQLFIDGIIGKHFSSGLSFYLSNQKKFLSDMEELESRKQRID